MTTVDLFRGRKILVVEDEYLLATELSRFFESRGAVVVGPVGTVATALQLIDRTDQIDLATVDINLRNQMAFAVADRLQERGIRFAFATGYDDDAIPPRYRSVPLWEKPLRADQIEAVFS
jgi:CheY-like chemotaxis protein